MDSNYTNKFISYIQIHKRAVLVGFAILISSIVGLIWLYGHSYVVVSIESGLQNESTITIIDQKSGKSESKVVSDKSELKILTTKGNKEIRVEQNQNAQLKIISTKGFLQKTNVSLKPSPEKLRTFVGNNPLPCTEFAEDILYSYSCNGTLEQLQIHKPASLTEPTYTQSYDGDDTGFIIGSFTVSKTISLLVQSPNEGDDESSYSYSLVTVDQNGNKVSDVLITNLGDSKEYTAVRFQSGLLVYDENFKSGIYIAPDSTTTPVAIPEQQDKVLVPYLLTTTGNRITVSYTEEKFADNDIHDEDISGKTEIVISEGDGAKHINLKSHYSFVKLCGENKLCVIGNGVAEIINIAASKPQNLFSVIGVEDIIETIDGISFTRGKDILALDISNRSASIDYSYGDYTVCGVTSTKNGYLVCIIDANQDKKALYVNRSSNNKDSIDKRIGRLLENDSTSSVSIYGRYIHVVLDLGERTFIPALGGYGYSAESSQKAFNSVLETARDSNINFDDYSVINTQSIN